MGLLSWLGFGAREAEERPRIHSVRLGYDAARTGNRDSRYYGNLGRDQDAIDALDPKTRQTLRLKSRYEIDNSPYARGLVHNIAYYVVGTGPMPQITGLSDATNERIEREFAAWSSKINLPAKLRAARISQAASGEVFGRMYDRNDGVLDLDLIEADRVYSHDHYFSPDEVDGISFDKDGQPVNYRVYNTSSSNKPTTFIDVMARDMLHLYRLERPGQRRGLPELTAALGTLAQLGRYTQAVLDAAENAAHLSYFFKTNAPPGESADFGDVDLNDLPSLNSERGVAFFLPDGWEPVQLRPEQPTANFGEVVHQYLAEVGRVCQMPAMIVTGDASNHNFASGRLDYQAFLRFIEVDRTDLVARMLDPLFRRWVSRTQRVNPDSLAHYWRWPAIEHVDEYKAANAAEKRIASGVSSLADEAAREGKNYEAIEQAQAKAYNLTVEEYRDRLAQKHLGGAIAAAMPQAAGVATETETDDDEENATA